LTRSNFPVIKIGGKNINEIIMAIVALVVAGLLMAYLGPVAISGLVSANLSGAPPSVVSMWGVLSIILIVGFLLVLVGAALKSWGS
jgi:uncharacterized membrane protein YidH (DUF202 family)